MAGCVSQRLLPKSNSSLQSCTDFCIASCPPTAVDLGSAHNRCIQSGVLQLQVQTIAALLPAYAAPCMLSKRMNCAGGSHHGGEECCWCCNRSFQHWLGTATPVCAQCIKQSDAWEHGRSSAHDEWHTSLPAAQVSRPRRHSLAGLVSTHGPSVTCNER